MTSLRKAAEDQYPDAFNPGDETVPLEDLPEMLREAFEAGAEFMEEKYQSHLDSLYESIEEVLTEVYKVG